MNQKLLALTWAILFPLLLWQSIGIFKIAGAVPALTVDVCPGGSCAYSTINEAVTAVPDGSIINLLAGTYTENLVITKSLTLQGQGAGVTVIDGGGRDTVILIDDVDSRYD